MKTHCAATVFPVKDLEESLKYYKEVLGFEEDFRFGEYAGIKKGSVLIHLSNYSNPNMKEPGSGIIYIFCDEVDEYYKEIKEKGAKVKDKPKDYPYGMRDFITYDPDGNQVTFGAESEKDNQSCEATQ